jgi:hypothetical protein
MRFAHLRANPILQMLTFHLRVNESLQTDCYKGLAIALYDDLFEGSQRAYR